MDNNEELTAGRRCSVVPPSQSEVSLFTRFAAAHLTEDYDYRAAYIVLDEANVDAHAAKELLLAVYDRLELKNTKLHGCNLLPIETSGAMEICEYLLYLQVKARRGETSEFARSVSPVLTELFRNYLLNLMQIDVRQLCSLRSGVYWITNETLSAAGNIRLGDHVSEQSYYDLYHQTYPDLRNTPLSFAMLLPLINFFCEQKNWQKDRDEIKKLRDFEENVRNKAAHQIAGLSEADLKAQFGFTTEEIIALLRKYFEKSFTDLCKNKKDTMWNSYEDMNRKIVKLLMA